MCKIMENKEPDPRILDITEKIVDAQCRLLIALSSPMFVAQSEGCGEEREMQPLTPFNERGADDGAIAAPVDERKGDE